MSATRHRGIAAGALALAIGAGAGLQALSALPGLGGDPDALFVLEALGSLVVLVVEFAVLAAATAVLVAPERGRFSRPLLGWSAAVSALAILAGVVSALLVPVAAVLGLVILPASALGGRGLGGFGVFRRHPVRAAFAAVGSLLLAVLLVVGALLAGFLLTGAIGGLVLWSGLGVVGALLLLGWAHLHARA
ncbi:MAG: hypothetical protein J0G30_09150 [Actinomycetales bacterium]|nr:hypothetical protein [Actinomycetales bacterium]